MTMNPRTTKHLHKDFTEFVAERVVESEHVVGEAAELIENVLGATCDSINELKGDLESVLQQLSTLRQELFEPTVDDATKKDKFDAVLGELAKVVPKKKDVDLMEAFGKEACETRMKFKQCLYSVIMKAKFEGRGHQAAEDGAAAGVEAKDGAAAPQSRKEQEMLLPPFPLKGRGPGLSS
jgi:hypothetical protein